MELIYEPGLNCHLACVLNLVRLLGVNPLDAFAALWSETDFTDEAKYNIYVSKRVFQRLNAMGIVVETLDCGAGKAEEHLAQIPEGERFLVGMDTFYIPWHPVFRHFHDPHYFFAQKETAHTFLCFDPVYGETDTRIQSGGLFSCAFELARVHKVDASPPKNGVLQEARAVLRSHPETRENILAALRACENEGRSNLVPLIKQVSAMIGNRYLFRRFFHSASTRCAHFFNEAYFLKWEAVRNGLYKATIVKENRPTLEEVSALFAGLMQEEMAMAKELILTAREDGLH